MSQADDQSNVYTHLRRHNSPRIHYRSWKQFVDSSERFLCITLLVSTLLQKGLNRVNFVDCEVNLSVCATLIRTEQNQILLLFVGCQHFAHLLGQAAVSRVGDSAHDSTDALQGIDCRILT